MAVLMAHASDASDPATRALAGVIGAAFECHGPALLPLPGLGAQATRALLARRFLGADGALQLDWRQLEGAERDEGRLGDIEDLVALLRDQVNSSAGLPEDGLALCFALACGCMGDDHLWQDLQLQSRAQLTALMEHWFTPLARLNVANMKWKRFFYKQLCAREEILICKSPSCGVCCDYHACFGPEEGPARS